MHGLALALAVGAAQIETGRAERVLVIGAETISRIVDPGDKRTAALFGDGAGAVVLGHEGDGEIGPIVLASDGGWPTPSPPTRTRARSRWTATRPSTWPSRSSASRRGSLELAGMALEDIDLFVYHQANGRIIKR